MPRDGVFLPSETFDFNTAGARNDIGLNRSRWSASWPGMLRQNRVENQGWSPGWSQTSSGVESDRRSNLKCGGHGCMRTEVMSAPVCQTPRFKPERSSLISRTQFMQEQGKAFIDPRTKARAGAHLAPTLLTHPLNHWWLIQPRRPLSMQGPQVLMCTLNIRQNKVLILSEHAQMGTMMRVRLEIYLNSDWCQDRC